MKTLLILLSSTLSRVFADKGLCLDYLSCMEVLEEKQRHCLQLDQNMRQRQSSGCARQRWDVRLELHGLHMRRAEVARDCVQRSIDEARALAPDRLELCAATSVRFAFAQRSKPSAASKKRSGSMKKKAVNNSRKSRAADCRQDAKLWHKQCSALANCCPQTESCKSETADIMTQIINARSKLQRLKEDC